MIGFLLKRPSSLGPSSEEHPPIWRRLFHVTAGSGIPTLGVFASQELMVILLAALSGLALVLETARFTYAPLNRTLVQMLKPLLKRGEDRKVTAATYMIVVGLGCFLLFDPAVAVAALFFLSVGDPLAALVGRHARGPRLWGKSPWGSMTFFTAAAALAVVLWATGVASPLWVLLAGGAVAAAAEVLPIPLDDNVTVPLISGGAMMALMAG